MAHYDISPSEFDVSGARIGIVAARFNDDVVSRLLEAALDTLASYGLDRAAVPVARVPGAFELPLAARWLAARYDSLTGIDHPGRLRKRRRIVRSAMLVDGEGPAEATEPQESQRSAAADAVIALGTVIRGDTPHFDYICGETARGIGTVSLEYDVPIVFGVLTCNDRGQALERAGGGAPRSGGDMSPHAPEPRINKGREAALAALEMISLRRRLGA